MAPSTVELEEGGGSSRREDTAIRALASTLSAHVREDADLASTGAPPVLRRDAHTKMHGCVQGELIVDASVPDHLKHGVFARPHTFRAWVRFSNAHGVRHDLELDPRGMAFKLLAVEPDPAGRLADEATTQDFLLATHHTFFVPEAIQFVDFPMALRSGAASVARFFIKRRLWRGAIALMRSAMVVAENPLTISYFSQTPYRLGPHVVKLQARPSITPGLAGALRFWWRAGRCNLLMIFGGKFGSAEAMRARCGRLWDPDGLQHAMARTLALGPATFDICVQTGTDRMPVEDATVPWSQRESPYRKVATLRIFRQPVTVEQPAAAASTAAGQMRALGERFSFSPWHGLEAHRPVGGINRARRNVYHAIALLRNSANGARMSEPSAVEFDSIRALAESDVPAEAPRSTVRAG